MTTDWLLWDAVRAEAAYRVEEMRKAGRVQRIGASRRSAKRTEAGVPRQRRGEHERVERTGRAR
ncbi:hypothetical protein SAMN05421810_104408 [Amycolatopsis arida]|uniref:Uncharacterized protein n=1 Tax=Amycolatopsis arida TaxID=587909 RepID=A0A1I5VK50_9PSEU|nr:hypothetical protein [Amycolatopsis arida]TDX87921.1 hypothetical protein CLV69_11254 [Amycolatopsis arida]SFQ07860.1 hypothetical protein SAMN05421810_104408 [Amycolatopsis arida]